MASFSHYSVGRDLQAPIMVGTEDPPSGQFLENLKEKLKIKIVSWTEEDIVFDLIGVDASIANALRRIMLAEVWL